MGPGTALPLGCLAENKKAAESGSSPPAHLSQPHSPSPGRWQQGGGWGEPAPRTPELLRDTPGAGRRGDPLQGRGGLSLSRPHFCPIQASQLDGGCTLPRLWDVPALGAADPPSPLGSPLPSPSLLQFLINQRSAQDPLCVHPCPKAGTGGSEQAGSGDRAGAEPASRFCGYSRWNFFSFQVNTKHRRSLPHLLLDSLQAQRAASAEPVTAPHGGGGR